MEFDFNTILVLLIRIMEVMIDYTISPVFSEYSVSSTNTTDRPDTTEYC
jgi:hypothetical protein